MNKFEFTLWLSFWKETRCLFHNIFLYHQISLFLALFHQHANIHGIIVECALKDLYQQELRVGKLEDEESFQKREEFLQWHLHIDFDDFNTFGVWKYIRLEIRLKMIGQQRFQLILHKPFDIGPFQVHIHRILNLLTLFKIRFHIQCFDINLLTDPYQIIFFIDLWVLWMIEILWHFAITEIELILSCAFHQLGEDLLCFLLWS